MLNNNRDNYFSRKYMTLKNQKKLWELIDFLLKNKWIWVREINRNFWISHNSLEKNFGTWFELEKNKKIYTIPEDEKEFFNKMLFIIENHETKTKKQKLIKLSFFYLLYKI
jgi:hypothetical protein